MEVLHQNLAAQCRLGLSARFSNILHGKIARMVDPFQPGRGNRLLRVVHNGERLIVPSIPKKLLEAAHATLHASLRFKDEEPVIEGEVDYRRRPLFNGTEPLTRQIVRANEPGYLPCLA
jgi:hypothetical protein